MVPRSGLRFFMAFATLAFSRLGALGATTDESNDSIRPPCLRLVLVGEYRAVPLHTRLESGLWRYPVDGVHDQDNRLSGSALGADVRIRLYRDWIEASYGLRVRYDHLYYEIGQAANVHRSVNALTADHLLTLRLSIRLRREQYLSFAGGGGYMNRGSAFMYDTVDYMPDGTVMTYTAAGNFYYNSTIASVSFRTDRIELGFTGYHNSSPNELEFPSPYWIIAIHAGFRLTK